MDELQIVQQLPLITAKPLIFACNVGSEDYINGSALADKFIAYVNVKYPGIPTITLSSLLEQEIVQIKMESGEDEAKEYMELSAIKESALDRLLEECSNVLGL